MIVRTRAVSFFGAGGITVFPFIFLHPLAGEKTEAHEKVHYRQQKRWALYGLGVGLIVWFLLYLLVLPVGWNPFRARWEMEAFKEAEGYPEEFVRNRIFPEKPYYLWWMKS